MSARAAPAVDDPGPVRDRILALDALRGLAVLGIFMMNVQTFAMAAEAYSDPLVQMDFSGVSRAVWRVSHLFFDLKFITLFSALFGAGVMMTAGGGRPDAMTRHGRRMGGLLLIGAAHAFLLWYGDILMAYAVWGLALPLVLRWSPGALLAAGLGLAALTAFAFWSQYQAWTAAVAADPGAWRAGEAVIAEATSLYRAGWAERVMRGAGDVVDIQSGSFVFHGPRILGCMMIGAALWRLGFLAGVWRARTYAVCALAGLALGLGPMALTGQALIAGGFLPGVLRWTVPLDQAAALFAAFGYAALVMLAAKAAWMGWLTAPLAAVGRMALTNYLAQSLIAALIFYGPPGLGLFGAVERTGQAWIVVAVWAAQLVWSPLWLRVFRFGPMEWAWRSLTYGAPQAMLRRS